MFDAVNERVLFAWQLYSNKMRVQNYIIHYYRLDERIQMKQFNFRFLTETVEIGSHLLIDGILWDKVLSD